MVGLPTVAVHLDDGTGTFPYDVTTKVRMVDGISITRGRGDEQSTVQPGKMTLTFDNTDGRFTLGSTIIASPSPIVVNRKIRVRYVVGATTYTRFVGFVQEWPVTWPRGGDEFSTVQITAADALAAANRLPLRSQLADMMLADGAQILYPMTEDVAPAPASGTKPAVYNIGPLQVPPMSLDTNTTNELPEFAAYAMPNGQGSIVTWPGTPINFNNARFNCSNPASAIALDATYSVEVVFSVAASTPAGWGDFIAGSVQNDAAGTYGVSCAAYDPNGFGSTAGEGFSVSLKTGTTFTPGTDYGTVYAPAGRSYADGQTHLATMVVTNSGKTLTVYLDGVLIGAVTNSATPTGKIMDEWTAALATGAAIVEGTKYSAGYLAIYPGVALSAGQAAEHAEIAATIASERSDQLVSRIAGLVPVTVTVPDDGAQLVSIASSQGDTAGSVIERAMAAEQGLAFVDGLGVLQFQNRFTRLDTAAGAPTATVTNDDLNPDSSFAVDMQHVFNRATITRTGGVPQTAEDDTSIDAYGVYPFSDELDVSDDSQAASIAAWVVGINSDPSGRLAGAAFDLMTLDQTTVQALAACDLSAWLRITGLPAQTPGGTTAELWIEGTVENIGADAWTLAVNTSPNVLMPSVTPLWRLNDATYQLGSNTALYI